MLKRVDIMHQMGTKMSKILLEEPAVQALLKENRTFDAVICEVFMNEAHFGFAEAFRAPLIGLSPFGACHWTTDLVGTPTPLSYVPDVLLQFNDHMDFTQRAINLAFTAFRLVYQSWVHLPQQEQLYRKYFPNNKQNFYHMRKNTALVLLNNHVSLGFPRPYAPNMIEVGGLQIERKRQPLPKDLDEFIKGAKYGVIYFSMGSNLKSSAFPKEKLQAFIDSFARLKQRVLWKFEDTDFPDKPDNVYISDWFPQNDVLGHVNVLLFITHGGLLSTTESIYHGKPIVGIPMFADQFMNMARAEQLGYGIVVRYDQLTGNALYNAIDKVLNVPSYTLQVHAMSWRFRDQQQTPLERAVFWVEHVSRHKGAEYLRSGSQDLNLIEYHNIDVLVTLFGGLAFVLFAFAYLIVSLIKFIKNKLKITKPKTKVKRK